MSKALDRPKKRAREVKGNQGASSSESRAKPQTPQTKDRIKGVVIQNVGDTPLDVEAPGHRKELRPGESETISARIGVAPKRQSLPVFVSRFIHAVLINESDHVAKCQIKTAAVDPRLIDGLTLVIVPLHGAKEEFTEIPSDMVYELPAGRASALIGIGYSVATLLLPSDQERRHD